MLAFAERLLSAVRTPGYWRMRLVVHMARRAGGGRSGRVRDATELSASELQVPGDLFVRSVGVRRARGHQHHADAPGRDHRRRLAGEPILCSS